MNEDERARRAQYREQMHYYRRYSGIGGRTLEEIDRFADELHGMEQWLRTAGVCFLIALAFIAAMFHGFAVAGFVAWYLLAIVPALFFIALSAFCLYAKFRGVES